MRLVESLCLFGSTVSQGSAADERMMRIQRKLQRGQAAEMLTAQWLKPSI